MPSTLLLTYQAVCVVQFCIFSLCLSVSSSYDHRTTPKLHVLGCDATIKVSTKRMGLKTE